MSSPQDSHQPNSYKQPGKTIGQGMLVACFVLGLAALTFLFDDLLEQRINPNQSPDSRITETGVREVVLTGNRQGHYVANGFINNIPVTFLLDTGATDVAIPAEIARQAGLEREYSARAATANGTVIVFGTHIRELRLGSIILNDISASITPSMEGDVILLGMSALQRIEFNQSNGILTLRQFPAYAALK